MANLVQKDDVVGNDVEVDDSSTVNELEALKNLPHKCFALGLS